MRKMYWACAAMAAVAGAASIAAGEVSAERGAKIFNAKELGTNGKSCSSCHPAGEGLEGASGLTDDELGETINNCIRKALKGEPIPAGSEEMKALLTYIRTIPQNKKH